MPFRPGISGNKHGRMPGQWLDKKRRIAEARKSFERLVRIRDGEILERKVIGKNKDGEPITADVVASIRDQIVCNDKIMNRAVGMPKVEGEDNGIDPARLFVDVLESLVRYLAARDPVALEHLEFHIRDFAEQTKTRGLLSEPGTAIGTPGFQGLVVDEEVR